MAAPSEPQLAGVLGLAVDKIDEDEGEVIVRWLRVHANVAMLDLFRNDVRRLGVEVPCARKTRVFEGTAFAAQAMKFFGPPPDGADVEAYLQERYRILKSQEKVVIYVNSCDDRENDSRKKWNYKTRAGELGDFNELALEFKVACPTYFDEETGAPFYQEQNFAAAFIDCIRRRNPELKCKSDIQRLCKKRRLLRNCNLTDAEKEALYHADYEVVVKAVAAAAAAPDAEPDAEPTAPMAPDATREAESPPPLVESTPDATDEEEDSPLVDRGDEPEAPDATPPTRATRPLEDTSGGANPRPRRRRRVQEPVNYYPVTCAAGTVVGVGLGYLGVG